MSGYVGRLAPSPTGALHLGNARTFLIAYLRARLSGGRLVMRMEDLDHPRDKPGAAAAAVNDLKWLGFNWDDEYVQSERKALYREALEKLKSAGRVYPCVCTRKDVEAAQSAPHEGEQLYYPGTCRGRFSSWAEAQAVKVKDAPCWRFKTDVGESVSFVDRFAGPFSMDVSKVLGDFPLCRDEEGAGYTLAVVVDDAAMGITEVVRGDDLLGATPAQILLQRALGLPTPEYCHVPLVVGIDGKRLAKRHGDTRIAAFRDWGLSPESVIGLIAHSCGWCAENESISLHDLLQKLGTVPNFMGSLPHKPWVYSPAELTNLGSF